MYTQGRFGWTHARVRHSERVGQQLQQRLTESNLWVLPVKLFNSGSPEGNFGETSS